MSERPGEASAPPGFRRPQSDRSGSRGGRIPSWIPIVLISALILGGLTMIAIGLTKEDEAQPPAAPTGGGAPAQNQQQPGRGQARPQQRPQRQQPRQPAQQQQPVPPPQPQEQPQEPVGDVPLEPRTFVNRFSIGIPEGWEGGQEGRAIALTAPGATAELLVFFQQGESPLPVLARGARGFLAERNRGAQIGGPKPTRIGGQRGLRITATYRGGEEVAVVISAKGHSYVILRRVDRGASPDLEQQADAALASFSPK
jgi:hypothetical protein